MEDISNNRGVILIPLEVIESLKGLKVFRISTLTSSKWNKMFPHGNDVKKEMEKFLEKLESDNAKKEMKFLEKLEFLTKLEELCIQLTSSPGVWKQVPNSLD